MNRLATLGAIDFEALRTQALAKVDVAVIDSGVDGSHPDLRERLGSAWHAERIEGAMTVRPSAPAANQDEHGHGTAVAGIVAAIAPNATVHDYKIFAPGETSSGEGLVACLAAAIESKARIINMSLAVKANFTDRLSALLQRAYAQGIVIVAAQRNYPTTDLGVPAELSYSIGVNLHSEASAWHLRYRSFHTIPFIARGENVQAPKPEGGYTEVTGTSFATPTVTGLCALLLGAHPDLEHFELKTILKAHALAAG